MKTITRFLAAIALAACVGTSAQAQEVTTKAYPHYYVGLQGGVQATFTNYKFADLITPIASFSLGRNFSPIVGARINVTGAECKGGLKSISKTYDYKFVTTNVDLLLNLTNLFSGRDESVFNVLLLGGVGLDYAWENGLHKRSGYTENCTNMWNDDLLSHNFRAGVQFNVNASRYVDVNLEVGANSLSDRFNSKHSNTDDWQGYAMLGVAFKFGHKKVAAPAPVVEPEPVWETRVDTIWYDETTYKEVEVMENIERNIYFPIRGYNSKHPARIELQQVADFVKSHKDCKVDIKSYADKGTGNPRINKKYAEQRREGTVAALVELGVPESIITSASFGDTVQPFAENDLNRVSITTASGKAVKKEPVKTRKFRTEEHRVRVQ